MKQYLVAGYIHFQQVMDYVPIKALAVLEDHEVMDLLTLAKVEAQLLAEHNKGPNTVARAIKLHSFQPYEPLPVVEPVARPHLNECAVVLPPVDSPLLIEITPGVLLRAKRPAHAEQREDLLLFDLEAGGMYIGRPRWTHP